MGIIGWIFFGLLVGVVGKLLTSGRDAGGFILTILLGIGGALLGGFVGQSLGFYYEGEPAGFMMAIIGSVILLLYCMIARRQTYYQADRHVVTFKILLDH
jgi:uncharacterized membrane protein YeaQ/YmgE (transglycosylase-associated protein family)